MTLSEHLKRLFQPFLRRNEPMPIAATATETGLLAYVQKNPGFLRAYESYEPDLATIEKINAALPTARVLVVGEYWCGDSRRQVPRMARIADHLPGWTFESLPWDSAARGKPLQVRAIPTFVVFNGDEEIGRIVENPEQGSLECDLLAIAQKV
jgi:hypothetical protein